MALLRVDRLTKKFESTKAVNGISFTIGEGRCVALLGPNGAGKTTTLKMLSGLLEPTSGSIAFIGLSGDIRRYIGFLPQYPAFYSWMTGKEFLTYVGKLADGSGKALKERVDELLETVGLSQAKNRRIGGYSGGMKQRLGIAQAMIHRPKLLMLDEPVSALDPIGRREVLDMLTAIKHSTTILFSTHVLHDAEEMSDDVLIMRSGEIAEAGTLDDIRSRHRQPVIIVEADTALGDWAAELRAHDWVQQITGTGRKLTITVHDVERARLALLTDAASRKLPISRFEVAQATLEDLFMKVVQS
jgi:ABC-2 type transport system ATP-binding protein